MATTASDTALDEHRRVESDSIARSTPGFTAVNGRPSASPPEKNKSHPEQTKEAPESSTYRPINQTINKTEHQHRRLLVLRAQRVSSNTGRRRRHRPWTGPIKPSLAGPPTNHGLSQSMAKQGATASTKVTTSMVVRKSGRDQILTSIIILTARRFIATHYHHLHPIRGCILQRQMADHANQNQEALLNRTHGQAHYTRTDVLILRLLMDRTLSQSVINW